MRATVARGRGLEVGRHVHIFPWKFGHSYIKTKPEVFGVPPSVKCPTFGVTALVPNRVRASWAMLLTAQRSPRCWTAPAMSYVCRKSCPNAVVTLLPGREACGNTMATSATPSRTFRSISIPVRHTAIIPVERAHHPTLPSSNGALNRIILVASMRDCVTVPFDLSPRPST